MTSSLEINGKELLSIKHATERVGYSRDYITRLAREGKVVASQIDRQWFVDLDSLENYNTTVTEQKTERQQQLSEERKKERQAKEVSIHQTTEPKEVKRHPSVRSRALALGVLLIGLGLGLSASLFFGLSAKVNPQVASVPLLAQTSNSKTNNPTTPSSEVATTVNFSHESVGLSTLEGIDKGILLLPEQKSGLTDVAGLFSDEVKILTDENGEKYVALVNGRGEVFEKIPFVVVPVNDQEKP